MNAVDQALKYLENNDLDSRIIKDLISEHSHRRGEMVKAYERYKGSKYGVPIFSRDFTDRKKVNNKLNNDFFSEIIDIKVGYFSGEPISYNLPKEAEERQADLLRVFHTANNIPDLDAETSKMAAICGYGARLLYIDRDGQERVMNVDPWECIFITDMSINEPQYSMRYYKVQVNDGDNRKERWRVEWYDNVNVTTYTESAAGKYVMDESKPHLFDGVPLIGFPNNEELLGDGEKVTELIDAYDRSLSDVNSEVEQFRLAYMYFKGFSVEPYEDENGNMVDPLELVKRTGGFEIPEDGEVGFITKMLEDNIIENHLDRVENNIYRFSKTPNFADEAFAGSQSGEARKYKMLPFENKCVTTERKFTKSLREMFKVLSTAWAKKGIVIDPNDIEMVFTRNFPLDLRYEAEIQQKLRGHVSEMTRLSLFSAVEDPEKEKEAMDEEQTVNLDEPVMDDEPTE